MKKKLFPLLCLSMALSFNLEAQIKVLSTGKTGVGCTVPTRQFQVGKGNGTNYNAYMRIQGNTAHRWWADHGRIEFTNNNYGIGVGHIDPYIESSNDMYFYVPSSRAFRWFTTIGGDTQPDDWSCKMVLNPSGNLYLDGGLSTNYTFYWSDKRLKENIRKIDSKHSNLYNISGMEYTLKENNSNLKSSSTEETGYNDIRKSDSTFGFIASEVQKYFPELVCTRSDSVLGVNYIGFIPLMLEALKDQQNQILVLESELAKIQKKGKNKTKEAFIAKDNSLTSELFQNSPNPFSIDTEIKLVLPQEILQANLFIYDLQGTQKKNIRIYERGSTSVTILASELQPGMYIYTLITDGQEVDSKRMILTD